MPMELRSPAKKRAKCEPSGGSNGTTSLAVGARPSANGGVAAAGPAGAALADLPAALLLEGIAAVLLPLTGGPSETAVMGGSSEAAGDRAGSLQALCAAPAGPASWSRPVDSFGGLVAALSAGLEERLTGCELTKEGRPGQFHRQCSEAAAGSLWHMLLGRRQEAVGGGGLVVPAFAAEYVEASQRAAAAAAIVVEATAAAAAAAAAAAEAARLGGGKGGGKGGGEMRVLLPDGREEDEAAGACFEAVGGGDRSPPPLAATAASSGGPAGWTDNVHI